MIQCQYCNGTGIAPTVGGLCEKCDGAGRRHPDAYVETRAHIIHCICGYVVADCPAAAGQRCPPGGAPR
jgi:hypothetical protein